MTLFATLCLLSAAVVGSATTVPTSPSCKGSCAADFATYYKFENANWVSNDLDDDSFWSIPKTHNATAPGDIIKWQDLPAQQSGSNWTVPGGTSLSRFLYLTENVDGSLLPASAFVLLPYKPPRNQTQLRTIVWAHGTAGNDRKCAPSNRRNLYYGWSAPFSYAQAGYAVIGPDYTGLGTKIPQGFMYLAGHSHAADSAFSLIAARKKLGDILTKEWVAIGQSEGGMTTWRLNQRLAMKGQALLKKPGTFLGSVAIAPAIRPLDLIDEAIKTGSRDTSGVGTFIVQTLSGLYPSRFKLSEVLTKTAYDRLQQLGNQGCVYTAYGLFSSLSATQTFRNISWPHSDVAQDWKKNYMMDGDWPLAAPQIIIQGSVDPLVPVNFTREDYARTCAKYPKSKLQLNVYEGSDHYLVTSLAQPDYLGWVDDRFNGIEVKAGCVKPEFKPSFNYFNYFATVYKTNT